MMLVSLLEASDHIRRDTDDDDADLIAKIQAASSAVLNYLKGSPVGSPRRDNQGRIERDSDGAVIYETNSNGDTIVRPEVKQATLIIIAEMYRNREGEQGGEVDPRFGYGYLPRPALALLYPLRDPALA